MSTMASTEITMPAMLTPLPSPFIFLERFSPMQLKMSPRMGMKNAQMSPAMA